MTAASSYRGRRTGFTCDILALLSGQIININQCWEFRLLTCGGWELPKQSVLIVCSPSAWKRNPTRPDTSSCTKTTPLSHLQAPGRVIGSWCATAQAESRQNQAEFQHLSEPWENRGEHQSWVLEKQGWVGRVQKRHTKEHYKRVGGVAVMAGTPVANGPPKHCPPFTTAIA